jgi:aryl-alcohol dehydrogenase
MQIQAAVVHDRGAPFRIETVELTDPAPDELIVRVVASGICQTDVHGRDDYYGAPFPCVFGHEGAGVVERVGRAVRTVAPGDHVIMCSPACGDCPPCRKGLPGYCLQARPLKWSGLLRNGKAPMSSKDGRPIHGAFFQQSSFATHSLATLANVVRVPREVPLEQLAAFPCGVNTGAGAVFNVLKPPPTSTFAVFGAGTVGLAGLMAARIAGCATTIAVDRHDNRLALALELGATHAFRAGTRDVVAAIRQATGGPGVDCALEAAGDPEALRQAVDALAPLGTCCLVGSARPGVEAHLEMAQIQRGRTVRGCVQGDAPGDELIPRLIEYFRAGQMPVDRLITYYDFADINRAVEDAASGRTVKAVLRMPPAVSSSRC